MTSALDEIHTQFGGDTNFFKFNKHTPKNPTRLLPLLTYFVAVPDPIDAEVAKKQINIKIDFHMLDKLESKTVLLSGANALGVPLAFTPRCLSVESLVGDKILTLARGSVGIPAEREADLPKQLYDLHHLISLDSFRSSADTVLGFKDFLSHELASFHAPVETDEILSQVAANLRRYATVSRSTADREALKVLKEFRGNYEPIPFRSLVEWELTAKRLEYFSYCFLVTPEESISLLRKADQLAEKITLLDKIEARRIRLLDMLRLIVTAMESKAVRNAPLERIFWELMATGKATVEEIQNKLAD